MTPKLNQPPRSPSASYTDAHVRARYSVKRTLRNEEKLIQIQKEIIYAMKIISHVLIYICHILKINFLMEHSFLITGTSMELLYNIII